jgi:RNA polymerase sigma factor (sigma-70 family)
MAPVGREDWDDLMRAANRGDHAAYARVLAQLAPVLRGLVRARGSGLGPEGCEDVVQEVLLAIHLKRHTWDEGQPLRPWLWAVARHKIVDAYRARGTRLHLPVEDFADSLPAEAAPDPTAARDTDRLLARIEPRAAEIVRAVSLEGLSAAETGARLGMTEGAVRVSLHRALRALAGLVRGEGG